MKKTLKKTLRISLWTISSLTIIVFVINIYINTYSDKYLYNEASTIPKNEYCLVLGTSKYIIGGNSNPYFDNRINAVMTLWNAKKISKIIVSGDNREENYNEPETLKQALLNKGVPDSIIFKDKDGYRTLNSIISCKAKFDIQDVIIVTQKFHNSRAIFLARQSGLNAIGFNANDIAIGQGYKIRIREWFAKVKAIIEII